MPSSLPVKNVAEYVALAKAKPGTLNYSHPGKGSTGHLGFELFKRLAGIDVTGIGYRGYPQMVPDIASGLISSTFLSANQALAQVQSGAIRIIGAISDGRSKYFPDAPTMAEQGFAEAQVTPWFGIVVPEGHAAAGRRAHQQGAGGGAGDDRCPAKARCGRLRGQGARRCRRLPISSSPTSRCGPRWSRRPASPRTEATGGAAISATWIRFRILDSAGQAVGYLDRLADFVRHFRHVPHGPKYIVYCDRLEPGLDNHDL